MINKFKEAIHDEFSLRWGKETKTWRGMRIKYIGLHTETEPSNSSLPINKLN
jgi:hypothetical protein